ncbi:GNAT family N-acetyltransferase [Vibrio coralliirubri]|uniref:GNAT family N-acetyltransferase n=1 Tax=Vibrio coralliirubri TaxID=1516159 RepID=UPI000B3645C8|nr:GNAT family N-acetyltransferase [Vibrio coralliirubri]MCY9862339.1 GNAT family N-acetyltransferase [Vibrio coralliirubri]
MENIRKAQASDLASIQELARDTINACYRSFLGDEGVDWFINSGESDKEVEKQLSNCVVLESNNQIQGYCAFENDFVHILMVSPNIQRSGFGATLLKHVENEMSTLGHEHYRLETFKGNDQAIQFYLKNGWSIDREETDEEFGFVRVYLSKNA